MSQLKQTTSCTLECISRCTPSRHLCFSQYLDATLSPAGKSASHRHAKYESCITAVYVCMYVSACPSDQNPITEVTLRLHLHSQHCDSSEFRAKQSLEACGISTVLPGSRTWRPCRALVGEELWISHRNPAGGFWKWASEFWLTGTGTVVLRR